MTEDIEKKIEINVYDGGQLNIASDRANISAQLNNQIKSDEKVICSSKKTAHVPLRYVILLVSFGSLLSIFLYILYNMVTHPSIKKIEAKENVLVYIGKTEDLGLDVRPKNADKENLKYKIYNEDIVVKADDWHIVGLDGLGDKNSDETSITIWGGSADPVTIHVEVIRSDIHRNTISEEQFPELD